MTKSTVAQKILLPLLGLVLVLILLEGGLRLGALFLRRNAHIDSAGQKSGKEIVLLCIGESTTALGGADSWPAQLQRLLESACPDKAFRVVNEGRVGVGSAYFAGRIDGLMARHRPDAVISMLGINDYDGHLVRVLDRDSSRRWYDDLRVLQLLRILAARISALRAGSGIAGKPARRPASPVALPLGIQTRTAVGTEDEASAEDGPVRALVRRGMEARNRGDFNAARGFYAQAAALDPDEDWIYIERGNLSLDLDDLDSARENFRRATELNPAYAGNHVDLGRCFVRAGDGGGAEKHFRRALELDPDCREACLELARLFAGRGDKEGALSFYARARRIGPDSAALAAERAALMRGEGDMDAAGRELLEACRLSGFAARDCLEAGRFFRGRKDFRRAREMLEKAREGREKTDAEFELACLAADEGRTEEAKARFEKLCAACPGARELAEFGNFTLYLLSDFGRAKELFSAALELDPGNETARAGLAWICWLRGDRRKALDWARGTEDKGFDALLLKARILQYAGCGDEARAGFDQACAFKPPRPEAFIFRAMLSRDSGRFDLARADFEKAFELDPVSIQALAEYANMCVALKDYAAARALLERGLGLDQDNGRLNYLRGVMFLQEGMDKEARAAGNGRDELERARGFLFRAVELAPDNAAAFVDLGFCLLAIGGEGDAAAGNFAAALEIDSSSASAWVGLWQAREDAGDRQGVGRLAVRLEKFLNAEEAAGRPGDDRLWALLAAYAGNAGEDGKAQKYLLRARGLRLNYASPVTRANYREIRKKVRAARARLFCVQYPGRSVRPLEAVFKDGSGIVFVDNEAVFCRALESEPYAALFRDRFAGDFGHATARGNALLARSVADALLKVFCPGREEAQ